MGERGVVGEGDGFGVGFEEEVEGIVDGHFGDEVDLDFERAGFFREDETGEVIGLRVLLPVEEVFGWGDAERVAENSGAAVGSGAETDDLGAERDGAVVLVGGDVVEGDVNGHGGSAPWDGQLSDKAWAVPDGGAGRDGQTGESALIWSRRPAA